MHTLVSESMLPDSPSPQDKLFARTRELFDANRKITQLQDQLDKLKQDRLALQLQLEVQKATPPVQPDNTPRAIKKSVTNLATQTRVDKIHDFFF